MKTLFLGSLALLAGLSLSVGSLSLAHGGEPGTMSSGCDLWLHCRTFWPDGTCKDGQVDTSPGGKCANDGECENCSEDEDYCPDQDEVTCTCSPHEGWWEDSCQTCLSYDGTGHVTSGPTCIVATCPPTSDCEEQYNGQTNDGECKCEAGW